jgi:hypothetical protein
MHGGFPIVVAQPKSAVKNQHLDEDKEIPCYQPSPAAAVSHCPVTQTLPLFFSGGGYGEGGGKGGGVAVARLVAMVEAVVVALVLVRARARAEALALAVVVAVAVPKEVARVVAAAVMSSGGEGSGGGGGIGSGSGSGGGRDGGGEGGSGGGVRRCCIPRGGLLGGLLGTTGRVVSSPLFGGRNGRGGGSPTPGGQVWQWQW